METFPHSRQRAEASFELVRLVGVAGPDASLELLETSEFALHQVLAFLVGLVAQFSQESLTSVGGPLQAEDAGDGGKRAPLLAQRHGIAVGIAPRLSAAIPIFS